LSKACFSKDNYEELEGDNVGKAKPVDGAESTGVTVEHPSTSDAVKDQTHPSSETTEPVIKAEPEENIQ
jgi:hypothetical protein